MCLTCSHVFGGEKYGKIKCHNKMFKRMNEDKCYLLIKYKNWDNYPF